MNVNKNSITILDLPIIMVRITTTITASNILICQTQKSQIEACRTSSQIHTNL